MAVSLPPRINYKLIKNNMEIPKVPMPIVEENDKCFDHWSNLLLFGDCNCPRAKRLKEEIKLERIQKELNEKNNQTN